MKIISASAVIFSIFISGCASIKEPVPNIVIDRDVAYVPYPSCPAPNKIEPSTLPIASLNKNSNAKEIATAHQFGSSLHLTADINHIVHGWDALTCRIEYLHIA